MQRMIHNWVKPHWGLGKQETPAMAMGYIDRPVTMLELLSTRALNTSPHERTVPSLVNMYASIHRITIKFTCRR
jgi:hypothetical protein